MSSLTKVGEQATDIQIEKFNLLLDGNADDFLTRSLMADYYLDKGDYVSEQCLRWQIRNHKRPMYSEFNGCKSWKWYFIDRITFNGTDVGSDLPEPLFEALDSNAFGIVGCAKAYTSRRLAEEALLRACTHIEGII